MRIVFGLASLSVVTGFCLVQACGGDEEATPATGDPDSGQTSSSGATSSSGNTSSSGGSSGTSSSGGTNDGGNDAGTDAGKSKMTFFVTSVGSGAKGGNLGGLAGADTICKDLAGKVGGGDHTWAAYLSTSKDDAKGRIGTGPWVNQAGVEIAKDGAALHKDGFKMAACLDETGKTVPNKANSDFPDNDHDILTGSNTDGTKHANTCKDWTSAAGGDQGRVGHSDPDITGNGGDTWNNAHNAGCSQANLNNVGGSGRIYCFAKD